MADATNRTVTIRENVITFVEPAAKGTAGAQPAGKAAVRSLRLQFGPGGTVHVTEADENNKFSSAGPPGPQPLARNDGSDDTNNGPRAGVYVMTHDYFAVCVLDRGTALRPPVAGADGATTASAGMPQVRSYCTVVLRRAAAPGAPAAAVGVSPAPGR